MSTPPGPKDHTSQKLRIKRTRYSYNGETNPAQAPRRGRIDLVELWPPLIRWQSWSRPLLSVRIHALTTEKAVLRPLYHVEPRIRLCTLTPLFPYVSCLLSCSSHLLKEVKTNLVVNMVAPGPSKEVLQRAVIRRVLIIFQRILLPTVRPIMSHRRPRVRQRHHCFI